MSAITGPSLCVACTLTHLYDNGTGFDVKYSTSTVPKFGLYTYDGLLHAYKW